MKLWKKIFFLLLQGKEIWRGNQNKKKRLFESEERELNGVERSVFDVINAVNN